MATISRGLKSALASVVLWPMIGSAAPILDPQLLAQGAPPVVGWQNGSGKFAVGDSSNYMAGPGSLSYSTGTLLLSYQAGSEAFIVNGTNLTNGLVPADVAISAFIEDVGIVNIMGSDLLIRAGTNGIPQLGAAPGQTLIHGFALDAAAVPSPYSVAMLFDITYEIPALAGLGNYLTFVAANPIFMPPTGFQPWGVSGGGPGFTFDAFYSTQKLPEPSTYALMLAALGAMGLATRRRKGPVA